MPSEGRTRAARFAVIAEKQASRTKRTFTAFSHMYGVLGKKQRKKVTILEDREEPDHVLDENIARLVVAHQRDVHQQLARTNILVACVTWKN